ncbi:hypothetical protein Ciccas_006901 [Cichlidogyrus casuarinus]|uniref:Uncharacterized protein n=1 Tax=Cichlidogyrus casuarinus TaxID=1844966 RepID=A0ABD2Q8B8_9PLAT
MGSATTEESIVHPDRSCVHFEEVSPPCKTCDKPLRQSFAQRMSDFVQKTSSQINLSFLHLPDLTRSHHNHAHITRKLSKLRRHNEERLAMMYFCLIFSLMLSTSVYGASYYVMPEVMPFYQVLYGCMYVISIMSMLIILIYLFRHRYESYEALAKNKFAGETKAKFSLRGEEVNWYLRLGVVLLTKLRLFGFLVLQVLVAAACSWIDSVVTKIALGVVYNKMHHGFQGEHEKVPHGADGAHGDTVGTTPIPSFLDPYKVNFMNPKYCFGVQNIVEPTGYFLPAISEFSAIVAAIYYEIALRIGKYKQIEMGEEEEEGGEALKECLNRSVPGLFFSTVMSIGVFAVVVYLESLVSQHIEGYRYLVHLGEETSLIFLAILACLGGFYCTRTLKFTVNFTPHNLDELLLYATYFITINFNLATIAVALFELHDMKNDHKYYYHFIFRVVQGILEIIQATLQTYFIQDSFYRCCKTPHEQEVKPGRNMVALLLGLNMSLWMIKSFETKHNDLSFKVMLELSNESVLRAIFLHATLPMAMLFRFHSTVCLSISFNRMYEDEISRFTSMLRGVTTSENGVGQLDGIKQQAKMSHLDNNPHAASYGLYGHKPISGVPARMRATSIAIMDSQTEIADEGNPKMARTSRRRAAVDKLTKDDISRIQNPSKHQRRETLVNIQLAEMRLAANDLARQLMDKKKKNVPSKTDAKEEGSSLDETLMEKEEDEQDKTTTAAEETEDESKAVPPTFNIGKKKIRKSVDHAGPSNRKPSKDIFNEIVDSNSEQEEKNSSDEDPRASRVAERVEFHKHTKKKDEH